LLAVEVNYRACRLWTPGPAPPWTAGVPGLEPPCGSEAQDRELRQQVIAAGNRARERQRSVDRAVTLVAIDQLLGRDLALPEEQRPVRAGTILGLRPSRRYVRLDDPPVELKVYTADVERVLGCRLEVSDDGVALRAADGRRRAFLLGDAIGVWVVGHDHKRRRWRAAPIE
jgi:ribonuclease R